MLLLMMGSGDRTLTPPFWMLLNVVFLALKMPIDAGVVPCWEKGSDFGLVGALGAVGSGLGVVVVNVSHCENRAAPGKQAIIHSRACTGAQEHRSTKEPHKEHTRNAQEQEGVVQMEGFGVSWLAAPWMEIKRPMRSALWQTCTAQGSFCGLWGLGVFQRIL